MDTIDWSKAPEGATHYNTGLGPTWWKRDARGLMCWDGQFWTALLPVTGGTVKLVEIPPVPQWNGTGLPPVGTVCEWFSPIYGWLGGTVVGHDGTVTVIGHNDGYVGCHPHQVRPVRTAEQLAAEARDKAVNAMLRCCPYRGSHSTRADCEALYDAGYRKVEPE